MRRFFLFSVIGVTALFTSVLVAEQAPNPAAAGGSSATRPAASPYRLVGTIKELMEGIVDPSSDVLFESVATDITSKGVQEKRPQTDEEWAVVEHNALMLAEAANLLKMPGRQVAKPGEKTKSEGPDAPELTAPEIAKKIGANRALWLKYANGLQGAALKALDAARKKSVDGLFTVGEDIDMACENCHLEYWYPNDKAAKALAQQERDAKAAEDRAKKANKK
jgi:hypothetical protein